MSRNEIANKITEVINLGLTPHLKHEGFRKRGIHFYKRDAGVVQVLDVQSSRGNTATTGRFRLNAGIHFPAVAQLLTGTDPMPEIPEEPYCILRRIFSPDRPDVWGWWTVDPGTDTAVLAEKLAEHWRNDIWLWLEKNKNLSESAKTLEDQKQFWPAAATRLVLEDAAEAARLVNAFILQMRTSSEANHPANVELTTRQLEAIQKWAAMHGLRIS